MTSFITDQPLDAMYAEFVEEPEPPPRRKKRKKLTKAEKEELRLKKEMEFQKSEMRAELKREFEMSKKTEMKFREQWEEMCREIKSKEMKDELEAWEKKVNRVFTQKNEKIELILDEMAETEDIRRRNFSTQLQMMDYLMDALKTFHEASHHLYEMEASDMLHDFYKELEQSESIANGMKTNCESIAHATQLVAEHEMITDYKIFLEKRDDCVNSEIEKRYCLRDAIVKKIKEMRQQLVDFHTSIIDSSLDANKYERFSALMERQRNFLIESNKLNNTEKRSVRIHAELQRDLVQEEREAKRKLNDLQLQYVYFMQNRKRIENEMKVNDEQTYEKLKIITSESFKAVKKYKKLYKFGELLLSLAASCRKYQTLSEKVLPWGDFQEPRKESEDDGEPFKLQIIDLKEHVDITEAELQKNAHLMRNFWRRQAIAEAQILILEQKKLELLKENQNYIDRIKSLSKADNVEDLKKTLEIESVTCTKD